MIVPLRVARPLSVDAVKRTRETDARLCFLTAQRDANTDEPPPEHLYRTGTIGMIMRVRKLSEGGFKILVQGLCRAHIQRFLAEQPSYKVRLDRSEDAAVPRTLELEALVRSVRENIDKLAEFGKALQPEMAMVLQSVEDPGRIADLVAPNLSLKVPQAQTLLETEDPILRLQRVNQDLANEIGIL